MDVDRIRGQLDRQEWRCVIADCPYLGGRIDPGMAIARAYDNVGLVHLSCAAVGAAPGRAAAVEGAA